MKRLPLRQVTVFLVCFLMVTMPALISAQPQQPQAGPPPVAPPTVREGDFAVRLQSAYGLGTGQNEIEAETLLGAVGIVPRNGWMADYPVTPDVLGELRKSVSDAADAKKLSMGRDEALNTFDQVTAEVASAITPYTGGTPPPSQAAQNYPDPTVINNYYTEQGPPVVTYYAPPPDYYYLYGWVPYPFFSFGIFFPGFFVLHDFHRVVFVHNRAVFISNHFNAINVHRVFRVDPVARFHGTTFAGIAAPRTGHFVSTGIPRSSTRIFNAPRSGGMPSGRTFSSPSRGGMGGPSSHGGGGVGGHGGSMGGHGGGSGGGHGR